MSKRRIFWVVMLPFLAGLCQAQYVENGAKWVEQRIEAAMEARGVPSPKLASHDFHYIFLFDSSQASPRSAYRKYVQGLIESFLNKRLGEGLSEKSTVSLYAYQLDLYRPPSAGTFENAPLTAKSIELLGGMPHTFMNRADGSPMPVQGGHDHVTPRRHAMQQALTSFGVSSPNQNIPILVVQFTTTPFNEMPGNRSIDAEMRRLDARTAQLEGTGFVAFDVPELPLKSGGEFPVYVWLYGPSQFTKLATISGQIRQPNKPEGLDTNNSENRSGWLVLVFILGAFAVAAYWLLKPIRVTISANSREIHGAMVRRGSGLAICGPRTTKVSAQSCVLSDDLAPGAPQGVLATISIPIVGSPTVKGELFSVVGGSGGQLVIDKPRSFQLKSKAGDSFTTMLRITCG